MKSDLRELSADQGVYKGTFTHRRRPDSTGSKTSAMEESSVDTPLGFPSKFQIRDLPIYSHTGLLLMNGRVAEMDESGRCIRHTIIGLFMFERLVRSSWVDAGRLNPYGEWHVQRVRASLQEAGEIIDEGLDSAEKRLSNQGFTLDNFPMPRPHEIFSVKLKTGLGAEAVDLVADADLLESALLFLRRLREISNDEFQPKFKLYRKMVRRALRSASGYVHMVVTRADIAAGSEVARATEASMGKVPEAVLELEPGECWTGPILVDPDR